MTVAEMGARLTGREQLEQLLFDARGLDETWLQIGTLCATIVNWSPLRDPHKPDAVAEDFIPGARRHEAPEQTGAEQLAALAPLAGLTFPAPR